MPKLKDVRILPYSPKELYDLVLDIDHYKEFLPWCVDSTIIEKSAGLLIADLEISYLGYHERFRSEVLHGNLEGFPQSYFIKVNYLKGPFSNLYNEWNFKELESGTEVELFLDFKFKSKILEQAISLLMNSASKKIITAFEKRAKQIYGEEYGSKK